MTMPMPSRPLRLPSSIYLCSLCLFLAGAFQVSNGLPTPTSSITIEPYEKTFTETWLDSSSWKVIVNNWRALPGFTNSAVVASDPQMGNFLRMSGGGFAVLKTAFNKNYPITVAGKVRFHSLQGSAPWIGLTLYASEAEYFGLTVPLGKVGEYCNAASNHPGNFAFNDNGIYDFQIEYDGQHTIITSVRIPGQTWTRIGVRTFTPAVHLSCQLNSTWGEFGAANSYGFVDFGPITITGRKVYEFIEPIGNAALDTTSPISPFEGGIEWANTADFGKQHFLQNAGGLTVSGNGGWVQGVASTAYSAGDFSAITPIIFPSDGYAYGALELMGGLRQGAAGSYLMTYVREADGTLVSDVEIPGNSGGHPFTASAPYRQSFDLSKVTATGIYLDIQGRAINATAKTWPDVNGTTGPPIIKQAAVTFMVSTFANIHLKSTESYSFEPAAKAGYQVFDLQGRLVFNLNFPRFNKRQMVYFSSKSAKIY